MNHFFILLHILDTNAEKIIYNEPKIQIKHIFILKITSGAIFYRVFFKMEFFLKKQNWSFFFLLKCYTVLTAFYTS